MGRDVEDATPPESGGRYMRLGWDMRLLRSRGCVPGGIVEDATRQTTGRGMPAGWDCGGCDPPNDGSRLRAGWNCG